MLSTDEAKRYEGRLVVMCPEEFVNVVEKAARKRIMNRSAYIREAVIERLKADGIDIVCGQAA